MDKYYYYEIAYRAKRIVNTLGQPLLKDNKEIGKVYKYEDLTIEYNKDIEETIIYISDIVVLRLNDKLSYIDGLWNELITFLYYRLPQYEDKFEEKEELKKEKLKQLEEYFKNYIKYNNNPKASIIMDDLLREYDIHVICCREGKNHHYKVLFKKQEVAKFNDDIDEIIPDIDEYIKSFKLGVWIDLFMTGMQQAKREIELRERIDESSLKMIKRFRKDV